MKSKVLRKEAIAIQTRVITLSLATVFMIYLTLSMSAAAAQGGPSSWDDPHFDINFQLKPGEYIAGEFAKIKIQVPETGTFTLTIKVGTLGQNGDPVQADLDATDDGSATIYIPQDTYEVYAQARGKPGGSMTFLGSHTRSSGQPTWGGPTTVMFGPSDATYSITNNRLHLLSTRWYET